jgi:prepilin-type processing-associated H-X9-DG protein
VAFIKLGLLYPYVNSVAVYKDPQDHSRWPMASYGYPRSRSMSMNCWMGPLAGQSWNDAGGSYAGANALRVFYKVTDINIPGGTSDAWVFIDENPYTIDDGFFVCDPNQPNTWVNVPATYHAGGGCISFADGHSEIKVWHDKNVLTAKDNDVPKDPGSNDLPWLQQRTTILASGTQ